MKNYREIAENIFERRDKYLEMQKRRKLTVIKTVSSVLGFAVAGCLSITVYNNSTMQEIKPEQNNSSYNVNDYTKPTSEIIMATEMYTTGVVHTTVSKSIQATSATVCTENTSTAVATTENSVIPPITTVHTATTVYSVPEYTSAMTTIFVTDTSEQTYFTSAIETQKTYTTFNVTATTCVTTYSETAGTIPVTKTTMTSAPPIWTSDIFTVETTQTTELTAENITSTETSTTTDIQSYATSLMPESTATVPTEIPETFVFFTTTDYRQFSNTENTITTVV